jgi:hypothetical protein
MPGGENLGRPNQKGHSTRRRLFLRWSSETTRFSPLTFRYATRNADVLTCSPARHHAVKGCFFGASPQMLSGERLHGGPNGRKGICPNIRNISIIGFGTH